MKQHFVVHIVIILLQVQHKTIIPFHLIEIRHQNNTTQRRPNKTKQTTMSPLPQQETFYDAYEIEISDQINAFPPVPQDDVYDEAWSIRVDELFLKIDRVEEDLVTVESAIRTASTQCLRGVTYNLQDQQHIDNVIDTLLCRLDALDIPQQAVFMRSQRKQLVKRIEGLTVAVPSVSSLSSSSSKKKKKSTTTRRVVSSSTCTPTKKEKRLAANAWAKQWSVKVFGK